MLRTLVGLTFFSFLFYLHTTDGRQKVILIDSGIHRVPELEPFLCRSGHRSYLPNRDPLWDITGHGTLLAHVLAEELDPDHFCIVSYQTFDQGKDAAPYARALLDAGETEAAAVVIALQDIGHYLDEALWLRRIAARRKLFIAAGNDGKDLSQLCDVYPACLAYQVDSDNLRVVGASEGGFNFGGPVNALASPVFGFRGRVHSGTSISTARAAGQHLSRGAIHSGAPVKKAGRFTATHRREAE